VLNTNEKVLIDKVMALFKEKEEDWWDELPEIVKAGINESIGQADRGEFISYDDVKKEVSALLEK
jgi:predicted transcriptional regulator